MAERFSLKDHLFNPDTLAALAADFARGVVGFDAQVFLDRCVPGLHGRELLERLDWMADCLEDQLAVADFDQLAAQLEAAMPAPLDPNLRDDDFGHFCHAVFGILVVRHGMDAPARALDVLHAATQRFSMEFYIRAFINTHPNLTLTTLRHWAGDPNYHVRRLVSEGLRPRLPWAKKIELDPLVPLEFLDKLHADPTRFVTRSVANHLNDISKLHPDAVLMRLQSWVDAARQDPKELLWMRRHALRTLIKAGHPGAMRHLGYRPDPAVSGQVRVVGGAATIGAALVFDVDLTSARAEPVILDYTLHLPKAGGGTTQKVFKMKDLVVDPDAPQSLRKTHKLKANATTFTLHPGPAAVVVTANGKVLDRADFLLMAPPD